MITDINYALSFMASEVMCSFTFHLNIHFLVVERHGVRIFCLMFKISPNLAEFVNNGNGAGVVTVSNFCITVIVKTLETSQLCKASFLVLSWIWPWGRWRPPGSVRVTWWRPTGDAPAIFTGGADRSSGVCWEVGHWHSFDSSIQRISWSILRTLPRPCVWVKILQVRSFLLILRTFCTETCHCGAQEHIDNQHDEEQDTKRYAEIQKPNRSNSTSLTNIRNFNW